MQCSELLVIDSFVGQHSKTGVDAVQSAAFFQSLQYNVPAKDERSVVLAQGLHAGGEVCVQGGDTYGNVHVARGTGISVL